MEDAPSRDVAGVFVRWVQDAVVAHDLCPFAAQSMASAQFVVCHGDDIEDAVLDLASKMIDDDSIETAFVLAPDGLDSFEDFLDAQGGAEEVLEESGADEFVLLAGFHPKFKFEGEEPVFALTNRSPVPALHLIRRDKFEDDMELAEKIVAKNQATIAGLSDSDIRSAWPHVDGK